MQFEYKILPLNRKSGDSRRSVDGTKVCVELDARLLTELLREIGLDDGVPSTAGIFAQVLGEMIGADVYYRPTGFTDWRFEKGYLPLASQYRERRTVNKHANEIAEILEMADNRAMATDGPVSATKDELSAAEFRKLYLAAKAIVAACANRDEGPPSNSKPKARKK